jgi:hypothetical protein
VKALQPEEERGNLSASRSVADVDFNGGEVKHIASEPRLLFTNM